MAKDPLDVFASDDMAMAEFGEMAATAVDGDASGAENKLDLVYDIPVRVTVELAETQITVKDLLSFRPGSVVELDRLAGEPANLLVNGVLVGRGDVVVVNERYGIRLTELISSEDRIKNLAG